VEELQGKLKAAEEETKEALEQQTATSEVLKVISRSAGDLQPVFDSVVENANRLCAGDYAFVYLGEGNGFRNVAAFGGSAELVEIDKQELRYRGRGTLVGRVALEERVVQIPDVLEDPEYTLHAAQRAGGFRTLLGVPMKRGDGALVGVIGVARNEVRPFAPKEIQLVETFADQALIAIDNVRLFNETKEALEQQTAVSEVLGTINRSAFDLPTVLQTIVERAASLANADTAVITRLEGPDLVATALHGSPLTHGLQIGHRIPVSGPTLSARAVRTLSPHYAEDIRTDPSLPQSGSLTRFAVPIQHNGQALGALVVAHAEAVPFTERQRALVATFADQAAIAMENVRLFNETKEALERQTATSELLAAMSQSAFDLKPVFEMVLDKSLALCHAEYGWIHQFADNGETFHNVAARMSDTMAPIVGGRVGARASVLGRVYRERRTLHVADITADPTVADSKGIISIGARTALGVPLLRGDQLLGAIILVRIEVRRFEPREIELVESFARQAAIAIENVRLFNEIQDTSRQLEVASRHKSEFLANMSHELRTPLNAIIGFSDVLIGGMAGQLDRKQTEYLEDIRGSGRHLLSLINDILDLSKVEAGRMELTLSEFSLRAALSNAVTMIRERAAGHGIGLDLAVDGIDVISADERKVKQILFNLLSNAVKFTPDGGSISVRAVRQDSEALVSVRDTGVGIPTEDRGRIFEEFRQSGAASTRSAEAEGTGLGLALTKSFVELHSGRIWVESEVGKEARSTSRSRWRLPPLRDRPPAGPSPVTATASSRRCALGTRRASRSATGRSRTCSATPHTTCSTTPGRCRTGT